MSDGIHPLADCHGTIGEGTRVWQFVVILPGAVVGKEGNICSHCFIEADVVVGDRVTIKNGVQLWDGMRIGNDVFIGPGATFTNDRHPRSRNENFQNEPILIEDGAAIGAGAVILPGVRIGAGAMVGAGAVVTRDVPAGATVIGNPSRLLTKKP